MKFHSKEKLDLIEAYAREYFRYDPETGKVFFVKNSSMNRIKAGDEAGAIGPYGYLRIQLFFSGKRIDASMHRIIWMLHYGEWPKLCIDHIDHCRTNNRIENLRSVTNAENLRNSGVAATNTSGFTGVTWNRLSGKWQAQYMKNKKMKYIGVFSSKEAANAAVVAARLADGFHDNHGTSA